MSRSKTPRLKKAQQEIVLTAMNLANKTIRDLFLSEESERSWKEGFDFLTQGIDSEHRSIRKEAEQIQHQLANMARFHTRLVGLTGKNLTILRRSWAPFQPIFDSPSGFGMSLKVQDPMVRDLLADEGLYDIAENIAARSTHRAMLIHKKDFVETMIEDLIVGPGFYTAALVWPGEHGHLGG